MKYSELFIRIFDSKRLAYNMQHIDPKNTQFAVQHWGSEFIFANVTCILIHLINHKSSITLWKKLKYW